MLAESYKVLDLVDMAKDYVSQGYSVVVFLNYKDSIDAFVPRLIVVLSKEVKLLLKDS